MIVHKCDRCGRDMVAWMSVNVYPSALNPAYNEADGGDAVHGCGRPDRAAVGSLRAAALAKGFAHHHHGGPGETGLRVRGQARLVKDRSGLERPGMAGKARPG